MCGDERAIVEILDPRYFFAGLDKLAIPYPATLFTGPQQSSSWLTKTVRSCGGMGVMRNCQSAADDGQHYWQQEVQGVPISVLCLAQSAKVFRIGINRQFVNNSLSEQHPFIFAGLYANYQTDSTIESTVDSYSARIASYFNYSGIFSLDLMWTQQALYVLEMNPRIAASFELYEQLNPELNLVDAHIRVCDREQFPELGTLSTDSHAYSIVYTPQEICIPAAIIWPDWVKDRPSVGCRIARGDPLCSVHSLDTELSYADTMVMLKQRECELLGLLNLKY